MSALWGAKQGSPPSKRSAVGLCLMYACIIVCVSRRPDLFILLGDEKRFWYAQGTWISTWSCLSAERSHYKFIRKSVYIPGKMYCTFALLWSFYMFFFIPNIAVSIWLATTPLLTEIFPDSRRHEWYGKDNI